MPTVDELYDALFSFYGMQGWWPLLEQSAEGAGWDTVYRPGDYLAPSEELQRFEIGVGAILTQNTSWSGARRALTNLRRAGRLHPEALMDSAAYDEVRLLIRSSGYFNQKQERLGVWASFFLQLEGKTPERSELLAIKGIGPETADSILLYAYGRPLFVADAYARRIVGRLIGGSWSYQGLADTMHEAFRSLEEEERSRVFFELHALFVEHGKQLCRVQPLCGVCFLHGRCLFGRCISIMD